MDIKELRKKQRRLELELNEIITRISSVTIPVLQEQAKEQYDLISDLIAENNKELDDAINKEFKKVASNWVDEYTCEYLVHVKKETFFNSIVALNNIKDLNILCKKIRVREPKNMSDDYLIRVFAIAIQARIYVYDIYELISIIDIPNLDHKMELVLLVHNGEFICY